MRVFFALVSIFCISPIYGQLMQGKIIFEISKPIKAMTNNPLFENLAPKMQKGKYDLLFRNDQTLWRKSGEDNTSWEVPGRGRMTIMLPERDQIIYSNLTLHTTTEQKILAEKKYLIHDSIQRRDWNLSDERKTILGHECRKAFTKTIQQIIRRKEENGQVFNETVYDTLNIIAWYAGDIPVSAGPDIYLGQLPGMILELTVNDDKLAFRAIEISAAVNLKDIKEPGGGKEITAANYQKEREKVFQTNPENAGRIYKTKIPD